MKLFFLISLIFFSFCFSSQLLKYGKRYNTRDLSPEGSLSNLDDGFSKLELKTPFIIDGEKFHTVYINVDGIVTFDSPSSSFDSSRVDGPYLAPFWGDVDLTGEIEDGNRIHYRVSENNDDIEWVRIALQESTDNSFEWRPSTVVVATWDQVGHFMSQTNLLNTFQVVLATDGKESYSFYNYPAGGINWWVSEQGQTSAFGYRTRNSDFTIRELTMEDIVRITNQTNFRTAGRTVSKLDGFKPLLSRVEEQSNPCFFGGSYINILGFGFQKNNNKENSLLCQFSGRKANTSPIITQGNFVSSEQITCESPAWTPNELFNVSVSINGGSTWSEPVSVMVSDCILSYSPTQTCTTKADGFKKPIYMTVESFPIPWNPQLEYFCKFGNEIEEASVEGDVLTCPSPSFSTSTVVNLKVIVKDGDRNIESREFGKLEAEQCSFIINKMEECSSGKKVVLIWENHTQPNEKIGDFAIVQSPNGSKSKIEVQKLIVVPVPENGSYTLLFENELEVSFQVDC